MARIQVNEPNHKTRIDLDRVPAKDELIKIQPDVLVQVTGVCHYPRESGVDAVVTAMEARQNLADHMRSAIAELDSEENR